MQRRLVSRPARRARIAGAILACAVVVASCGSDDEEAADTTETEAEATTTEAAATTTAAATTVPETTEAVTTTDAATTTELPTTTLPPTTTAPPASTVAPTTATAIVVTPSATLGWWDGTSWVDSDVTSPSIPVVAGTGFSVTGIESPLTTAVATGVRDDCEFIGTYSVALDPELPFDWDHATSVVAVNATWNPVPRPPAVLDPATATAEDVQFVQEQLTAAGIGGSPVAIAQLLRVDLDGDGTDETVIAAEHPSLNLGEGPRAGWYSTVLLRSVIAGVPTTTVLFADVHTVDDDSYPSGTVFRVDAIADLNGDGRSEIVVGSRQFEGVGATVFALDTTGVPQQVLTGGCGT